MSRILVAVAAFPPYASGTGNVAWHNARLLAQAGHDVDVLTPGGVDAFLKEGFRVLDAPRRASLGNASLFRKLPDLAQGYDVIHLHLPFLFGADQIMRAPHPKLLVTYHQDLEARGPIGAAFRAYAPRIRAQLRAADAILVPTLDYARASRHATDLARAIELPNGVDTSFYAPRREQADAPFFLFVGGLDRAHHFKGVDVLLRALSRAPDARAAIVGEGDLRPKYERLARELGVAERARFLGRVEPDALAKLYASCVAVVLPSTTRGEIFGLALVEGMACGRPGLASDLPGVRTVVDHEKNGLLVPPGDAEALARALTRVLADPDEADAWGKAARAKAVARYDWSRVGEKLLPVVEAL